MENGKTNDPTNEFEVVEVFGIDSGMWIDLKSIIIVSGVFEETIERVEHFVRQQEKELAAGWSVVATHSTNSTYRERPP